MNLCGRIFTARTYLVAVTCLSIKSGYLKFVKHYSDVKWIFKLCLKLFYYIFQKEFHKWNFISLHAKTRWYFLLFVLLNAYISIHKHKTEADYELNTYLSSMIYRWTFCLSKTCMENTPPNHQATVIPPVTEFYLKGISEVEIFKLLRRFTLLCLYFSGDWISD